MMSSYRIPNHCGPNRRRQNTAESVELRSTFHQVLRRSNRPAHSADRFEGAVAFGKEAATLHLELDRFLGLLIGRVVANLSIDARSPGLGGGKGN